MLTLALSVLGLSAPDTRSRSMLARRTVLFGAVSCASCGLAPVARADGIEAPTPSFEAFAQRAQRGQPLADPFAVSREEDPSRSGRFVDELPPQSPEERRQAQRAAAEQIWSTDNRARPAPLVSSRAAAPGGATAVVTDEFSLEFDAARPLGLTLKDLRVGTEYGTTQGTSRVLVANVVDGGQAAASGRVAIDNIVVAVNGANVERASAKEVTQLLARARAEGQPVRVTFKDALAFNERLSDLPESREEALAPVVTQVAPGGPNEAPQVLAIRRLEVPDRCTRNAQAGDLVEIRYTGRLADGTVFDGMDLAERFGDDSLQFVLGRQPAGQFPPSWDVGLVGMCVGERRLLDVPPVLGFGAKGMPKRNVPPNARLLYDVELLAINALSTP